MNNFFYLVYAEQCSTAVIVTLKNGALASQGSLQGMYQISDPINGKQSWTLNPYAIWYSLEYGWLIGNLDNIGENVCSIYANDDYGGLDDTNNQWNYWDGSNWIPASANDIFINCTSKIFFQNKCLYKLLL